MKRLLFLILLAACCAEIGFAQNKLSSSRTSSLYTYIYQLNDQEAFEMASNPDLRTEERMLHNLVDSFQHDLIKDYPKKLPYGNYLYVKVTGSQLNYKIRAVQNIRIKFINDANEFRFAVTDLNGNPVDYASVTQGKNKKLKFDPVSRSYIGKLNEKTKLLSVVHEGVYNCFTYYYRKPVHKKDSRNQPRDEDHFREKYIGQLIFSKPRYRPRDTVKFKAYLLSSEGVALKNKQLRVELSHYGEKKIFIANINPYRSGGYESSFVLADSLKLRLGGNYTLELKIRDKKEWVAILSNTFRYEDYELNSATFTVRSDKTVHHPGKPITYYLKATDENGLAVPDGKVSVTIKGGNIQKWFDNTTFLKSVLWTTNLNLDPLGETKLTLPDSIFPKANMGLYADFNFRNSNNETVTIQRSLNYEYESGQLVATLGTDSIQLVFLRNGIAVREPAALYTMTPDRVTKDSMEVSLPARLKFDPMVSDYKIKLADGTEYQSNYWNLRPDFRLRADHSKDSLKLQIGCVPRIPFWYTLFAGIKAIKRGYTSRLDTVMSFGEDEIAEISIDYLWKGEMYHEQKRAFYDKQRLNIQLQAPVAVYPGQSVQLKVNVTDIADRPVANTDLTAYAYTAKFHHDQNLYPFAIGPAYRQRDKKNLPENPFPLEKLGNVPLEWNRWHQKFGLDSIAFYQFSYPDQLYIGEESIRSDDAVAVPFAIENGEIDPAYIVYIDSQPVYYINADQLRRYAFKVAPGLHKVELLTFTRHIMFEHDFRKGFKTILGITSDPTNTRAQVRKIGIEEFTRRQQELQNHLLYINENFEGNKTFIHDGTGDLLLNPPPNTKPGKMLRIGPLAKRQLVFTSAGLSLSFTWQPDQVYTFLKDGIKTTPLDSADKWVPYSKTSPEARSYRQNPVRPKEIDSIWNDYMDRVSRGRNIVGTESAGDHMGYLSVTLDTAIANRRQYLKNMIIYKMDDPNFRQIFGAGNLYYSFQLNEGLYRFLFLFKDNQYLVLDNYQIRGGGTNFMRVKRLQLKPADEMSNALDKYIKYGSNADPGQHAYDYKIPARQVFPDLFEKSVLVNHMSGLVIDASSKETLPNATIYYQRTSKDALKPLHSTTVNGFFDLMLPRKGILTFTFTGYDNTKIKIKNGIDLRVFMTETRSELQNVVIRGYVGSGKRNADKVPVANIEQLLQHPAPEALVVVDGKPYSGNLALIDQEAILSIEVLNEKSASSLYGDLGKNGVVLIRTNGTQRFGDEGGNDIQQQTMRSNFSDAAFWQPKLLTDKNGTATFNVRFPDDITSWNTGIYAVNDRQQSGYFKTFIRSFKTLSANLTTPQFALPGDQISVIGKLMNYHEKEEHMVRSFVYNDKELLRGNVSFKNAHIDTITLTASSTGDSLKFQYTLQQDSGYFDGELRKIPLLKIGANETKGYFSALAGDTTLSYSFDPALGSVTLHAESSVFPVLLDEMEKLRKYEYLCNEQIASKLKALLLEQKLKKYLAEEFKGEKGIMQLIGQLQDGKTAAGTWGWWQDSDTEIWISGHAIEALIMARQAGFEVELNTAGLISYLEGRLNATKNIEQLFSARLLRTIDSQYDLGNWLRSAESQLKAEKALSIYQNLMLMRLKQQAGLQIDLKWLLARKKSTLFGHSYWGEAGTDFWDNSIQITLLAYQLLKAEGGHEDELQSIMRYFLEQRKDGQWRNTYESALILETILPDLMIGGKKPQTPLLMLNKTETVSSFPFTKTIAPSKLTIDKKGKSPIYFTAYQQFQNANPEKTGKDLTVKTSFQQDGKEVTSLRGGTAVTLTAAVEVRADADYVMIEIPIPAGCSYASKTGEYWGPETHREYFKHKTSIFCTRLKQGKYTFTVQLMPRYSGIYNLNPARAEMMYFPVFYGREGMKKVTIR